MPILLTGPGTKVAGAVEKNTDVTPSVDVTYTESGGVISATDGIFDGWNVTNWAGLTHIKDVGSTQDYVEVKLNVSGSLRPDVLNSWPTDTPNIYMPVEIKGDFDFTLKCDVDTGGDIDKTIALAVGYPDSVDKAYDHYVGVRWGAWNGSSGKVSWFTSSVSNSPKKGTGSTINYGTPYYLRIARQAELIRFFHSSDGESWSESLNAGGAERDRAGAECRVYIVFGSNASPSTDTFYIHQFKGTYTEA